MPFIFDPSVCAACPHGLCIEDLRKSPIKGRRTKFRLKQLAAMNCSFDSFCPTSSSDPDPKRSFDEYLNQFRANARDAGANLFGSSFDVSDSAIAKVEGDVFEDLEAAALWNAFAAWNQFMRSGNWPSGPFTQPEYAVPTPTRRVACLTLPRGYDTTRLFNPVVRNEVLAFMKALESKGMRLGLSSPDIVGVRVPTTDPAFDIFDNEIANLNGSNLELLEGAYRYLEGKLDGRHFLFAIAVKRTTRSDRLYQPLFEANILKFLIEVVLKGASFKFHVHMGSFEGADVVGAYSAASLISLMRGGNVEKAVDETYLALSPLDTAQHILNSITGFPL